MVWLVITTLAGVVATLSKVFWDNMKECRADRAELAKTDAKQQREIGELQAKVLFYMSCSVPTCPFRTRDGRLEIVGIEQSVAERKKHPPKGSH